MLCWSWRAFTASSELVEDLEEFTCKLYGDTSKDINATRYTAKN